MASEAFSAYVRFFVRDEVSSEAAQVERAARGAADGMDEAAEASGTRLTGGFDRAKIGAGNLLKGVGVLAGGLTALVGGVMGLSAATSSFQEDMGKLETAFSTTGHSAETAQSVYNDFVGLLGETDQSVEAANHLAELTNSTQELSDWGTIASGVYAKFGDSLPLEGLTEAANHTAKLGEVQGPLADALEWAGVKSDDFNKKLAECNSEEERATLITQTLNGIYGEAGAKYQEVNADLIANRQAQSDFNAAMAAAGEVVRPFATAIMNVGTAFVTWALPYIQQFGEKAQELAAEYLPQAKEAFDKVISVVQSMLPILAGVMAAFVAYKAINGIIAGVNAIMTIWRSKTLLMQAAQMLLNGALRANPVGIVITLIAGLVGALVTAWNTSETFRNTVIGAWNAVKSAASSLYKSVSEKFDSIKTSISSAMETARKAVKTAIDKIKGIFDFSWSLPEIKLPHFKVSGGKAPWGFGGQGSLPSVGVEWYAKGAIFDSPTLFSTPYGFKGVGEAGAEAVAPLADLMGYVRQAVREEIGGGVGGYVANINVTTGETSEDKLAKLIAREEKRQAYALGAI